MMNLFTQTWMEQMLRHWNATQSIVNPLQQAGFSARIGYGFKSDPAGSRNCLKFDLFGSVISSTELEERAMPGAVDLPDERVP